MNINSNQFEWAVKEVGFLNRCEKQLMSKCRFSVIGGQLKLIALYY